MPYAPPEKTKILLAVSADKTDRLSRVLAGHDLVFAKDRLEAERHLEADRFGMVVIGVHFDESQMFNLLGDIRRHGHYRKVPVLVVLSRARYTLSDIII